MAIYGESSNQSIHIGTDINAMSMLKITSSNVEVAGHILPGSNLTYDLGASNARFRDLYLSGNTIDLGGNKISTTANGSFQFVNSNDTTVASVSESGGFAVSNLVATTISIGNSALYGGMVATYSGLNTAGNSKWGVKFTIQNPSLVIGGYYTYSPIHFNLPTPGLYLVTGKLTWNTGSKTFVQHVSINVINGAASTTIGGELSGAGVGMSWESVYLMIWLDPNVYPASLSWYVTATRLA